MRAWLRLLRVPNLLTVPGDVLAGIALAAADTGRSPGPLAAALAVLASLCLYAFGLILNDLADVREDRIHRPDRPLVDGSVTPVAAQRVLCALLLAGLLSARAVGTDAFWVAFRLAGFVAAYDLLLKSYRLPGAVGMGLCRATSLLLGATAAGSSGAAAVAAIGLGGYIGTVTWMAAEEHRPQAFGPLVFAPVLIMLVAVSAVTSLSLGARSATAIPVPAWPLFALSMCWATHCAVRLSRSTASPEEIQRAIGVFIRVLIPWQAAYVILGGQPVWLGISLLAAWPVSAWLGRRYAAS